MVKDTLQNATGPVEYTLTNDYMFRAVCQKNERVLKGLVCSLLGLTTEEVRSITIQNPIQLGETITDKDIVLDIRILLNDNHLLNIEMQVADDNDPFGFGRRIIRPQVLNSTVHLKISFFLN